MEPHFGLFDSGIGGLTVLRKLMGRFGWCEYTYVGDSARAPYGPRGYDELWEINREIIVFLISKGVTHLVMACNTSCSQFLDRIVDEFGIRVTGIVTAVPPLIKAGNQARVVVLATQGTVKSRAYHRAIVQAYPDAVVHELACPSLVPIIERGVFTDEDQREIRRVFHEALEYQPTDIVYGCTHYPFLDPFWRPICPSTVSLLDPADGVVAQLEAIYPEGPKRVGKVECYVSANAPRFEAVFASDPVFFGVETVAKYPICTIFEGLNYTGFADTPPPR
jgi:glutamate racemase